MEKHFGENIHKLGFGTMRLSEKLGKIDIEEIKQIVDIFMQADQKDKNFRNICRTQSADCPGLA